MESLNIYRWIICGTAAVLLLSAVSARAGANAQQVSWVAENAAILRAVAAMHPDEKVRCPDHLAAHFVTEANWHYSPYSRNYDRSIKFIQTYRIGSYYYVNALTHHIDGFLREAGAAVRQVVLFQAGFETHAYRFHNTMPQARFFELDLPGTGALKKKMVRAHLGRLPEHVVFVSFDPQKERLEFALKDAGYDEMIKTLFLWTGATYHLSAEAVEAALDFVANHSAPGSRIAFDYIPAKTLADKASQMARFRRALAGEPLTYGIPDEGVADVLAARGLSVVSDLGWQELQQRYLMRSDGTPDGQPSSLFRVAVAEVPLPGMAPVKPDVAAKQAAGQAGLHSLSGTWTGTDSLGGRLVFRFSPGGGMTAQRKGGRDPSPKEGTYTRKGPQIDGRMDDIDFTGTAKGNQISGRWRQGSMGADFTLTRKERMD